MSIITCACLNNSKFFCTVIGTVEVDGYRIGFLWVFTDKT